MIDRIERAFEQAKEIAFITAAFRNDPQFCDSVIIGFDTAGEIYEEYNELVKYFMNDDLVLVVNADAFINLTLINERTSEVFNVNELRYSKEEFEDFERKVPHDKLFQFVIGCGGVATIDARKPVLWIKKKVFTKKGTGG
jgi:hypothetical protein